MITKYGTVESEVAKTAEGRDDAAEQRKEAEKRAMREPAEAPPEPKEEA